MKDCICLIAIACAGPFAPQHWCAAGELACALTALSQATAVEVQGTIAGIMEVYPLRLRVVVGGANQTIQLRTTTEIYQGGSKVDANRLRERQQIKIRGTKSGSSDVIAADRIDILNN